MLIDIINLKKKKYTEKENVNYFLRQIAQSNLVFIQRST